MLDSMPKQINRALSMQQDLVTLWMDSNQTILLRLLLAPPWLSHSPWVQAEWQRMTAEKVSAAHESALAMLRSQAGPAGNGDLSAVVSAALQPYTRRTRSNARRLRSLASEQFGVK